MTNPFDGGKPPDDRPRRIGLAAPTPLSSAELEAKYGNMKHDGLEILWPTMFEDADGHREDLTPHDRAALKHLGVTEEEYLLIELERGP